MAIFLTFHHRGNSATFGPTASNFHRIFKIPQRGENIGKSNGGPQTFYLDLSPLNGVKMAKWRFLAKMAIFLTFHHRGKSDTFGPTAPNFHRIFKIPEREENIGKSNGGLQTF